MYCKMLVLIKFFWFQGEPCLPHYMAYPRSMGYQRYPRYPQRYQEYRGIFATFHPAPPPAHIAAAHALFCCCVSLAFVVLLSVYFCFLVILIHICHEHTHLASRFSFHHGFVWCDCCWWKFEFEWSTIAIALNIATFSFHIIIFVFMFKSIPVLVFYEIYKELRRIWTFLIATINEGWISCFCLLE